MIVWLALSSQTSPRDWSSSFDDDDEDAIIATALDLLTPRDKESIDAG